MYDDTNYEKIRAQLLQNHTGIPPVYRAQIMDDALNVAKTGLLQYSTALSLTQYLKFERGLVPWMAADRALGYLDDMLQGTSFKDDWKVPYIRHPHIPNRTTFYKTSTRNICKVS